MQNILAISPCPNDTFIFHGILSGRIHIPADFIHKLLDIHELNRGVAGENFAFSKVSSVTALRHQDKYSLCSVGAALGYGVGPLLLKAKNAAELGPKARVLAPGDSTTAFALVRHFYPELSSIKHTIFSEIMPALIRGDVDYGVVIHEGRFVYRSFGLECEADLGELWEKRYALPLPLGCLVAHRGVNQEIKGAFEDAVTRSINYSYENRNEALDTMRRYAQELSDSAITAHVDTYVNRWSLDIGSDGRAAFDKLKQVLAEIKPNPDEPEPK
jgi:1,4-dihydroxy-6-naphthoate synthase